jgi:hypothetical protein
LPEYHITQFVFAQTPLTSIALAFKLYPSQCLIRKRSVTVRIETEHLRIQSLAKKGCWTNICAKRGLKERAKLDGDSENGSEYDVQVDCDGMNVN